MLDPDQITAALRAAVAAVGGEHRDGQARMAEAVAEAIEGGEHLLVQAGTGTGKSLGYLVPAVLHALDSGEGVVVATATIALQHQVVDRDLPAIADALAALLPRRPTFAVLKGRRNYVCRNRVAGGMPVEDDEALFTAEPTTATGREVVRARAWAEQTSTGDRDELVPGVGERAWSQVSVGARECLGAARCPVAADCFAELARDLARDADIVVTNHALLAIDAIEGLPVLPEHDVVVVDEAHELVERVTGAATAELSAAMVERAAKRAGRVLRATSLEQPQLLERGAATLTGLLTGMPEGRLDELPEALGAVLASVRDASRATLSALSAERGSEEGAKAMARAAVEVVHEAAERLLAHDEHDVSWLRHDERRGPVLHVAPLAVHDLLRATLFEQATVVLTSATLTLGGSFEGLARGLGLVLPGSGGAGQATPTCRALDVGSPFDYPNQGILYVARHLPPPGREGISEHALEELGELVNAAGGRTLGLFSSLRAAQSAAEMLRERLDLPLLCQGEQRTAALVRAFAEDPRTCLFGTLSLWQGVDVPGVSCQLVVIDRIPFPRPDDPLMSARARAVERAGGNGFMAVSAAHAALRLAQGAGRLIRSRTDRGVVAVLDSRLATARYASFLRASLPPLWWTTDREQVLRSLAAIDRAATAAAPRPA